MRILPLALIIALLAAPAASARTKTVKVGDNFFKPRSVTVRKGTTVKWTWIGDRAHDVVVRKGPRHFQSPVKTTGTFKRKMRKRGTYKIVCLIHEADMRMTLKVT